MVSTREIGFCLSLADSNLRIFPAKLMKISPTERKLSHELAKYFGSERIEKQVLIGKYRVDIFINGYDLIIEVDGQNHQKPNRRR